MLPLPRQRAQLQWQHRVLSNEQLTWLAALPAQGRAHDIELWHGSGQDPITGWISSPQDAADHLARQQARIGLVGHTHQPLIAEIRMQILVPVWYPFRKAKQSGQRKSPLLQDFYE
jgi:diadenosine tetraphosphatase ApaH/serine/threonine PP2A family protein phosphatase